jgi:hypothetical protein
MKRTYILSVLVLICVGYLLNKRFMSRRSDLASAKEKIGHIEQQPVTRSFRDKPPGALGLRTAALRPADPGTEGSDEPSSRAAPMTAAGEKVVYLTKGTFTVIDGSIVYGPDAQLDIGHGMLVSSPSGVMVSDVDQRHIAGDLVIESPDGTTTTENAFLSVDNAHVEMTSDTAVTVKKDAPK